MKYWYNVKAGTETTLFGHSGTALNDISVPVEVLFNENDSCGEVVPIEDATLDIQAADGTVHSVRIEKGENFVLGHEDISAGRPAAI